MTNTINPFTARYTAKELSSYIGVPLDEASSPTLDGRIAIIKKLCAAKETEVERGRNGHWLYDMNRHLNLCASLSLEYEALSKYLAENHMAAHHHGVLEVVEQIEVAA
jgi:hypothetical protein